jgi:hypothetical protein
MNDKESKLKALKNIKALHETMIEELTKVGGDKSLIDEMLEKLWEVMKEIEKLENEHK